MGFWKKGCQEPVTGAWTQRGPLSRVRFRGVKDRPTRRQVWGGESGVPDGGGVGGVDDAFLQRACPRGHSGRAG